MAIKNPRVTIEQSRLCKTLWFLLCICTLGFPNKYLERLAHFEDLVPESNDPNNPFTPWSQPKTFSDRGDAKGSGQKTMRQKQQEEWDRLNIAVSVITATSAAALAIQSVGPNPNQTYWLVTAFYSAAFGMSLQGLILITYFTISAGGSSDETIGRLASGQLYENQPIRPVAFMMSLPAILATYSSFGLLAGLVAMILKGPGESVATKGGLYITVAMIPVGFTFLCLCVAVVFCEVGTYIEGSGRRQAAEAACQLPQPMSRTPTTEP